MVQRRLKRDGSYAAIRCVGKSLTLCALVAAAVSLAGCGRKHPETSGPAQATASGQTNVSVNQTQVGGAAMPAYVQGRVPPEAPRPLRPPPRK